MSLTMYAARSARHTARSRTRRSHLILTSQSGMDMTTIAVTNRSRAWATYIDDEDGRHYTVEIRPDGISELSIDCKTFYTKN
mgnify:CR=1 FL=1